MRYKKIIILPWYANPFTDCNTSCPQNNPIQTRVHKGYVWQISKRPTCKKHWHIFDNLIKVELKQNVARKKGVSVFACTVKCSPANIMINTNILIYHNLFLIPNHFIRLIESKIKSVVNFVAIKSVCLVISVFVEIKRVFLVN